jgi:hypothetical protein
MMKDTQPTIQPAYQDRCDSRRRQYDSAPGARESCRKYDPDGASPEIVADDHAIHSITPSARAI